MTANAKPLILFQSVFKDGTSLTATDTDADADVLNIIDHRQGTFWKAASSGTKTIEVDMGSAVDVDSLGIISHNLGADSANATLSVESSTTGAWASEEIERLAGFIPADDTAIFKPFTSANARYWRLKIVTAAVAPFLAVALLGESLEFERWIDGVFKPKPQTAKGETNDNADGLFINSVVASHRLKYNVNFSNLTPAWVTANLTPAIETHLKFGLPFFWVWDKDNHPTAIYYVRVPLGTEVADQFNRSRESFRLSMVGVTE